MSATRAPGPPFRAEHIGSLLRPRDILEGRAPDRFIAEAIRWQESLGLQVVTDGEFRRESWRLGFVSKVEGFVRADAVGDVDLQRDDAGNVARIGAAPLAAGKVRRTGPIVADEVAFSLRHAKTTVKATMPAPSYLHYPRGKACVDPAVYPDLEEFFADVVDVYVQELRALESVGGRYLQIDEVAQPLLCDENLRAAVRARGEDPDRLIELYIGLINRIVRRRPAGMTIGVHMCRGNAMGKWMASRSRKRSSGEWSRRRAKSGVDHGSSRAYSGIDDYRLPAPRRFRVPQQPGVRPADLRRARRRPVRARGHRSTAPGQVFRA